MQAEPAVASLSSFLLAVQEIQEQTPFEERTVWHEHPPERPSHCPERSTNLRTYQQTDSPEAAPNMARCGGRSAAVVALVCHSLRLSRSDDVRDDGRTCLCPGCGRVVVVLQPGALG